MAHHLHLRKKDLRQILNESEADARRVCESESTGSGCRTQCMVGAMTVAGRMSQAIEGQGRTMQGKVVKLAGGKLGIIVSPMEDCPSGFEEILVKGGRNRRVKVCRLDEKHRKKFAPKGKPAHVGPLRRKTKPRYLPGVTARDIREPD